MHEANCQLDECRRSRCVNSPSSLQSARYESAIIANATSSGIKTVRLACTSSARARDSSSASVGRRARSRAASASLSVARGSAGLATGRAPPLALWIRERLPADSIRGGVFSCVEFGDLRLSHRGVKGACLHGVEILRVKKIKCFITHVSFFLPNPRQLHQNVMQTMM